MHLPRPSRLSAPQGQVTRYSSSGHTFTCDLVFLGPLSTRLLCFAYLVFLVWREVLWVTSLVWCLKCLSLEWYISPNSEKFGYGSLGNAFYAKWAYSCVFVQHRSDFYRTVYCLGIPTIWPLFLLPSFRSPTLPSGSATPVHLRPMLPLWLPTGLWFIFTCSISGSLSSAILCTEFLFQILCHLLYFIQLFVFSVSSSLPGVVHVNL